MERIPATAADRTYADKTIYSLIAPSICFLVLFGLAPFIYSLYQSLLSFDLQHPETLGYFAGLKNYSNLLRGGLFFSSLLITLKFVLFGTLIEFPVGFLIAAYLQGVPATLRRVVLTTLIVPMVIAPVCVGMIWKFLLNPQYGVLIYYAGRVGLNLQNALSDPISALWAVRLIDVWQWTPFTVLLFQACLTSVPKELLDAAAVDGLSVMTRYRYIILPWIIPTLTVAILLRLLEAFKVFDSIFVLTDGGPGNATEMVSLHANRSAFVRGDYGYAAADIAVLNIVVFIACAVLLRLSAKHTRMGSGRD
jgi:multiple sugar transport system permease protein